MPTADSRLSPDAQSSSKLSTNEVHTRVVWRQLHSANPRFPRGYPEISTALPRLFHGVTPNFPRRYPRPPISLSSSRAASVPFRNLALLLSTLQSRSYFCAMTKRGESQAKSEK